MYLADVLICSANLAHCDSNGGGQCIANQALHLVGHRGAEEQRLPVRPNLSHDRTNLKGQAGYQEGIRKAGQSFGNMGVARESPDGRTSAWILRAMSCLVPRCSSSLTGEFSAAGVTRPSTQCCSRKFCFFRRSCNIGTNPNRNHTAAWVRNDMPSCF